jgi:hypothetical protein
MATLGRHKSRTEAVVEALIVAGAQQVFAMHQHLSADLNVLPFFCNAIL